MSTRLHPEQRPEPFAQLCHVQSLGLGIRGMHLLDPCQTTPACPLKLMGKNHVKTHGGLTRQHMYYTGISYTAYATS